MRTTGPFAGYWLPKNLNGYWVRSAIPADTPGETTNEPRALLVNTSGKIISDTGVISQNGAWRPAMNLDTSDVLFSALTNSKISGETGMNALKAQDQKPMSNWHPETRWKLTLTDPARTFDAKQTDVVYGQNGDDEITFTYTGAVAGDKDGKSDNEFISCIVTNKAADKILYYGHVQIPEAADGEAKVVLPAGYDYDENRLFVFNENYHFPKVDAYRVPYFTEVVNGRNRAKYDANGNLMYDEDNAAAFVDNFTDYSSNLVELNLMHHVYFDSKGGTECQTEEVRHRKLAYDQLTTRDGYKFLGWTLKGKQISDGLFDFANTPILEDTYLEAHWEKVIEYNDVPPADNPKGGESVATGDRQMTDVYIITAAAAAAAGIGVTRVYLKKMKK